MAAGWVVALVAGIAVTDMVDERLLDDDSVPRTEAAQGLAQLMDSAHSSGEVIALIDDVDRGVAGVEAAVRRADDELTARPDVVSVQTPYTAGLRDADLARLQASDGRGLLVVVTLAKLKPVATTDAVEAVEARFDQLATELHETGQLGATVRVGGDAAAMYQLGNAWDDDFVKGELIVLPIALLVLVIVFSSFLAGLMPLAAAVISSGAATLLVLGFTVVSEVGTNAQVGVRALMLALAIDYALLLVSRYREELFAGYAPEEAVGRAWATAGRTVVFSSLTIAAALSGLLVFDHPDIRGLGAGAISIAMVAMLTALTFSAALLGMAGKRIKPAPPATHAQKSFQLIPDRAFARIAAAVQRRPWTYALVTVTLLSIVALPALSTKPWVGEWSFTNLPPHIEAAAVSDELVTRFGRLDTATVTVVARTEPETLGQWAQQFGNGNDPAVEAVSPGVAAAPGVAVIAFTVTGGDAGSEVARELVQRLRDARPDGVQSWVTGDAAELIDIMAVIRDRLLPAVALTLAMIILLLFAMTGSLVVPVKAILANVVSLGAMLGIMNLVFQRGFLSGPLDTITTGGLDPAQTMSIVAFAFALSVDYEVFLISRIAERVQRDRDPAGGDSSRDRTRLARVTDLAVAEGLQHTGRIITSAALLIIIVYIGFAIGKTSMSEQVGLGMGVAILIDATIVRCLLVPASMTLMGRWNWWAPSGLKKLHARFGLREEPLPEPAS